MNWYSIYKLSQRINYYDVTRRMPPYKEEYAYIGHNLSGQNKVFLWFMDDKLKFHTIKADKNMQAHQLWSEYTNAADAGAVIAQGRYDTLTDEVSLGGFPDDYYKNPRKLEYIKNKIEETLYEEFGPTIIIRDFVA